MDYSDAILREILTQVRTIALVGASMKPDRPSHQVGRYLAAQGYRVIPVNPGHAGAELFGERVVARLGEIDAPVDMVDIFRRSEEVAPVVAEALEAFPALKVVWMQLGVRSEAASALAAARGVTVIEDRCPKIEHARLIG